MLYLRTYVCSYRIAITIANLKKNTTYVCSLSISIRIIDNEYNKRNAY